MKKKLGPVLFLADDKKSITGNMMEDRWEIMIPDGLYEEVPGGRMVRILCESEAQKLRLLGVATGINFKHCLYEASSHCTDFFIRVEGYAYVGNHPIANTLREKAGREYLTVAFYEALK